ncbi:Myosin-2 heavy chain [Auxenochlorella protothecoides]|uniref:Myosin-2 heavy chain n=1 Tax=Auxenochlorella protothecoides TaxID=3075 RepID=A0A087SEK3_AUXPR|nr:Myosin-2 heavy chain [Auxenochlorella protothecoides]KFM24157.1 Myosin-2 heavy chain [Auxenochlorella protothecoides]
MSAVTGLSWSGDSLEGLGWGSRVWVLADGTWCPGTLASTGRDSATLEVFLEGAGKSRSFPARDVAPANPVDQESSDDLTTLPFVTEPGLLRCLQSRFDHDAVYTTAGPVLVAVNPFKPVPLYDVEAHRKAATPGTPHVYTVAQHAFSQMKETGNSQSILITGESGAGKTETTKFAMQYLAVLAGGSGMERRVLDSNPLLEAFGNASTLHNANSSRFGKLTTIHFDDRHAIAGATIQTYLLEKSRVVSHAVGERSFHAFYQLCAGAGPEERAALGLPDAAACRFAYLSGGESTPPALGPSDAAGFAQVKAAMEALGVPAPPVLRLLAAVLWLGDLYDFCDDGQGAAGVVGGPRSPALRHACRLLGVAPEALAAALTTRELAAGGERVSRRLSPAAAAEGRDALAKALYARLFDWLVRQVNVALVAAGAPRASIAVLDIYGFEAFATNSFEQLCINYANERLHQQFNAHLFKLEQAVYRDEGIDWTDVEFVDNQDCVDLLEARPPAGVGVLSLLDEECLFPQGNDTTFGEKLRKEAGWHPRFSFDARAPGTDFCIHHSSGSVVYSCAAMLDKNRDTLSQDPLLVLTDSSEPLLRGLVAGLDATQLHFIRCLKPNAAQRADAFDPRAVLHQLRCCGVLEVVRLARAGFPARHAHADFAAAYAHLLGPALGSERASTQRAHPGTPPPGALDTCLDLVRAFDIPAADFRAGRTRLFFRAGVLARLQDRADRVLRATAEKERAADVAAASCLILTGEVSFGARRTESLPCAEPSLPSADLHAQLQEALAGRREAETDAQLLRAELEQLQQSLTGTGGLSPAWAGDRGRGGFKAAPHPDAALAAARASGRSGGTQPGLSTSLDDVSFMSVSEGGEGASPDSQFTPSPPHPGRPEAASPPTAQRMLASLARDFRRKATLFDDDVAFIMEVHSGASDAPGMDPDAELAALQQRYRVWKTAFKGKLAAAERALRSGKKARRGFKPFGR